jgi:hypothetical protein
MNWDAISAIGEIVGAAAVVITLGYLAIQIRQSTKLANVTAHERAVEYWSAVNEPLLDPVMAELFQKGCESYQSLSSIDRLRFHTLISNMIFSFEMAMDKQQHGFATDDFVASFERYFEKLITQPGVREFLAENRDNFTTPFHEWLDRTIGQPNIKSG